MLPIDHVSKHVFLVLLVCQKISSSRSMFLKIIPPAPIGTELSQSMRSNGHKQQYKFHCLPELIS